MKRTLVCAMLVLVFVVACNSSAPQSTPVPAEIKPAATDNLGQPAQKVPPQSPAQKPGGTPLPKPGANFTPPAKPGANITPPPLADSVAKTYSVTNPTTNVKLYVQVFAPKDAAGKKSPTLVLVPGGTADTNALIGDALRFSSAGILAVIFDPDGRGKSTGQEDFNGHKQQDGLAAVVRFAATLPEVDAQQIGIATYSYGITMGSGALARYSDLPVKFLMDWEGPADRNYTTTGCRGTGANRIQWQPCTDNVWWAEREAVNFIGKIRVPYQRVQSEKDHVQPNNNHALDMINAAIKGGVSFVRLNNLAPNQTYDVKNPPPMLPEMTNPQWEQTLIQFAQELFKR
ncbi:MAG: hypothetical protein HY868_21055 [Chloroflexi bacterium]|nr:hypothetical protein [Chloroflexota bacterium]